MTTTNRGGRREKRIRPEVLEQIFKDYDEGYLKVEEIMTKYGLSRYMFYKVLRERRGTNVKTERV